MGVDDRTLIEHGQAAAPERADRPPDRPLDRPLGPAVRRGWLGRCPNCGSHTLFESYLTVRAECPACHEALHHQRADDLPAWGTLIIVGHVMAAVLLTVEDAWSPPLWLYFALLPALVVGMSLWLLPRLKGAVVGMQWAWRMHGFGEAA